jgi:hypothetical protein
MVECKRRYHCPGYPSVPSLLWRIVPVYPAPAPSPANVPLGFRHSNVTNFVVRVHGGYSNREKALVSLIYQLTVLRWQVVPPSRNGIASLYVVARRGH